MRVSCLFGAGASIPILNVRTADLTNGVLSGTDAWKGRDARYYVGQSPPADADMREPVAKVTRLLGIIEPDIRAFLAEHYGRDAAVTYEDLYYACDQVVSMLSGELENPLVGDYVKRLEHDADSFRMTSFGPASTGREVVEQVARESCRYIRDTVAVRLGMTANFAAIRNSHQLLLGALADRRVSQIDILTLNHDLFLEELLRNEDRTYVDGFIEYSDGVRKWDRDVLLQAAPIRLFKVHGSIDWFRFRSGPTPWWDDWLGQVRSGIDPDRAPSADGGLLELLGGPEFLLGSFNKIMDYTRSGILDLFLAAWLALRDAGVLVVSGYSFGDKGINARITDWMYSAPRGRRRLVVIHPDPDRLAASARGAVRDKWKSWRQEGVLRVVKAKLADANWADVRGELVGPLRPPHAG